MKITPPTLVFVAAFVAAGCSIIVNADRSKVQDDLFHPADAGASAGGSTGTGGDVSDGGGDEVTEPDEAGEASDAADAGAAEGASDAAIDAGDGG